MIPFVLSTEESALVRGGFFRRSRENKGKTNMKQLKFMLAAATAVGIAAVVQAGEKTTYLVGTAADAPENFESAELAGQNPVGTIAGYDFQPTAPATAADNESLIKDGALNVNTGTDPLLRALDWSVTGNSANSVALTADKSLYIDTMVQFTVTPVGDSVTATAGDKLMIYLQEVPEVKEGDEVVSAATTKLMVKAAQLKTEKQGLQVVEKYVATETVVDNYQVEAGEWYHLKVNAFVDAKGKLMFKISIKDADDTTFTELLSNEEDPLVANDRTLFPSLQEASEASVAVKQALTHVGFAGEGKVDDLLVWTVETISSVDFTLALGEGVSAVSYTVGDDTGSLPTTEGATSVALNGAAVVVSSITYAPGYVAGDNVAGSYPATEDGTITIDAKKNDSVKNDGTTKATGSEVGFADTVFAETTGSALEAVVAWTGSSRVSTDVVKSMQFTTTGTSKGNPASAVGTPARAAEEAFLLNCAPSEVEDEKAEFVFSATDLAKLMDPNNTENLDIEALKESKKYIGELILEGATELGNWHGKAEGDTFFRARLVFPGSQD